MSEALAFYIGLLVGLLAESLILIIIVVVKNSKERTERYRNMHINYGARLDTLVDRVNNMSDRVHEHNKVIKDTRSDISKIYIRLSDLEVKNE